MIVVKAKSERNGRRESDDDTTAGDTKEEMNNETGKGKQTPNAINARGQKQLSSGRNDNCPRNRDEMKYENEK